MFLNIDAGKDGTEVSSPQKKHVGTDPIPVIATLSINETAILHSPVLLSLPPVSKVPAVASNTDIHDSPQASAKLVQTDIPAQVSNITGVQ